MIKICIKELALENGFSLKLQSNGEMDLHPYVYDFARAVLLSAREYACKHVSPENLSEDYDLAIAEYASQIEDD